MIFKVRSLVFLLLCLNSFSTYALGKDYGWNIGAQIGNTFNKCDEWPTFHDKKNGVLARGFVGFDINKYFGLELGYTDYPSRTTQVRGYEVYGRNKTNSVDLLGKFSIPVYKELSLVARAGVSYVRDYGDSLSVYHYSYGNDIENFYEYTTIDKGSYQCHELKPMAGIGLSYNLSTKLSADVNYLNAIDSCSKGFYTFGFTYKFK